MGYKKLSNEQELIMIEEYRNGTPINSLLKKYGYATRKSITDKIKKHYPDQYNEIIQEAKQVRKGYCYKLEKIISEFDAYYLGLLLTDGYISRDDTVGLDLVDEDCIQFLSKGIGKEYNTYTKKYSSEYKGQIIEQQQDKHRLVLFDKELVNNLKRFGVIQNKSKILPAPQLLKEEEKYIPYIIRGIIDGDGSVNATSYGAPQFRIVTASKDFAEWLKEILENRMFMTDISLTYSNNRKLYVVGSAQPDNILKLIALCYNKPFGMMRKYTKIRETFRDYNGDFLEDKKNV